MKALLCPQDQVVWLVEQMSEGVYRLEPSETPAPEGKKAYTIRSAHPLCPFCGSRLIELENGNSALSTGENIAPHLHTP